MRVLSTICCLALVLSFLFVSTSSAVPIITGVNNPSDSFYDGFISTTDLVNVGQPTLSGPAISSAPTFGSYTVAGSHDGTATLSAGVSYWHTTPTTLTYNLDTTVNTLGYDITDITSIVGFSSDAITYSNQRHTIQYSLVDAPSTFLTVTTLSYNPFAGTGGGSSLVSVTDSTGVVASGVAALRFIIPVSPNGSLSTSVFREIDIFGQATLPPVPEPCSATLLLGGLGILLARKRRPSKA